MCGAGAVAVGDGGEPLDVCAEQRGECVAFGVTQFGELFGHVRYRAVVLADLDSVADRPDRRREPGVTEGIRNGTGSLFHLRRIVAVRRCYPSDDRIDPAAREFGDRGIAADFPQLAHRGTGKVVVCMPESTAAAGSDLKVFGGPTPTAMPYRDRGGFPRLSGFEERIQVTSDTSRAESETTPDIRGGDGPFFEEELDHRCTGMAFVTDHNRRRRIR